MHSKTLPSTVRASYKEIVEESEWVKQRARERLAAASPAGSLTKRVQGKAARKAEALERAAALPELMNDAGNAAPAADTAACRLS